ncbi:glycolate oxidase [Marmoricola endophyticus]|uniref:Glycolate oxidase n=1 Tax=Marmoricola endophyticus TaxID=2040280 RepID=A0A917F1C1_9ACTN|nr:FAD-binding oxidoreductase [Marmoricola endophyticus]GGF40588.1 glycolate oxidase [Marmoricola endophyticus]
MTVTQAAESALGSACPVTPAGPGDAVDGTPAGLVARPASTDEVAEVMRAAAAHGLSVVPRGRGTKQTWGRPPSAADVVVDLAAMDAVLDHAAGDLIVETQAGARLEDVQAQVATAGQRLVVDDTVPGASMGGTLAAHTSGPQRMLVGTVRDLLIGVTVVRADGVVAHAGGRVVKNVAGYDLGKLLIGSYGTLGVVTEAVFRLHPVPEARRWVAVDVPDAVRAHEVVHRVVHAQVVPHAVEVETTDGGGFRVAVLLGGREAGVVQRCAATRELLGPTAADLDAEPDPTYPWAPGETGLKLTCLLSGVGELLGAAHGVGARVRGSAGTGVLYAALPPAPAADVAVAVERLRATCTLLGGSAVVVDAPAEVKQVVDVWGPVPGGDAGLDLMRRVKDRFDPEHRLAPGRFVGGI